MELIHGRVVARKCKTCGHREIGIETENGEYIQLKPGMKIDYHVDCRLKSKKEKTRAEIAKELIAYAESLDW